jgi:membrane fusion protein (multidrug efflux system)
MTAGYMVVEETDVAVRYRLTGRAVSLNDTQLRPRVGGAITAILYTPGGVVQAGDPLFAIDPLTYEAALASATATRQGAEADLSAARTAFDRAERLRAASATSEANWETAHVTLLKAEATLARAQADEDLARAQLGWTTVRAPIAGVISVPKVALGDLVTQNQGDPLADIVQIDPIYLDLSEPYSERLRIEGRAARGEITLTEPGLALLLGDGRRIDSVAKLVSTGATVSQTTGTRLLRFELANPRGVIAPGLFLHAELAVGTQRAILVPQRATARQRDGTLTAWVTVGGKAERRKLTEVGTDGNAWIVTGGLAAGDWVLIDGTSNLRDGQEVAPVPAEIDENGVVQDIRPAGN